MTRTLLHIGLPLAISVSALAAEPTPGVSVTVYNSNFAVVKELRTLDLPGKISTVQIQDVAREIDPTSVHFKSLTDPEGTVVLEQNFEFDLLSADKLLEKYIDRSVVVVTQDGRYKGKLLSFDARQLVIQGDDQLSMIQRSGNVRNLEFGKLPEGLLTRPTLLWEVAADKPGQHLSQITYQTSAMNWQADYVAVINPDDSQMEITGWVTVTNRSGADYKAARIKLIAGDVRRIRAPRQEKPRRRRTVAMSGMENDDAGLVEKPFFEYHLYTLGRTTDINDNQIKQIELLSSAVIPVVKQFVFEPGGRYWHRRQGKENLFKTNVYVEFKNDRDSNMGMPLPKGKIRLYKADPEDGELEFIGEDQIDHTPRDEQLRLYIGDAFDVVGERTVSNRKQDERWREESIRIELRNHKDEHITIQVLEHLSHRRQWEITASSADFNKIDATTIQFDIPVER